jgi:predicted RNA binding protein YcfA (HicA-like mRNA interferase family)
MMFFDQGNEIRRRILGQRGFCEVRVRGNEVVRRAIKVGEITAPTAGNENLCAGTIRAFQKCHVAPTFAGFDCAHESGGSRAKNHRIAMIK